MSFGVSKMRNCFVFLLLASGVTVFAQNIPIDRLKMSHDFEEDYDAKKWEEIALQLPAPPKKERLIAIYVSAATEHQFFIDPESLSLGKDGVARFTLVVRTSGGATNVSFEGMRCETRERRAYAFGRADGSWSKARRNEWVKIREENVNRQYAALFGEYLCPDGVIAGSVENIVYKLRHQEGGAPRVIPGGQ